jgi:hypothetical protein
LFTTWRVATSRRDLRLEPPYVSIDTENHHRFILYKGWRACSRRVAPRGRSR